MEGGGPSESSDMEKGEDKNYKKLQSIHHIQTRDETHYFVFSTFT